MSWICVDFIPKCLKYTVKEMILNEIYLEFHIWHCIK